MHTSSLNRSLNPLSTNTPKILKKISVQSVIMKEFGKNYETFLAALYISINRWTPVWTSMLCCLRYCGVEVGTSDLVNWEGPWMPRGPDLGVLPSLHGVMYKHWIIKLHLSISPPLLEGAFVNPYRGIFFICNRPICHWSSDTFYCFWISCVLSQFIAFS